MEHVTDEILSRAFGSFSLQLELDLSMHFLESSLLILDKVSCKLSLTQTTQMQFTPAKYILCRLNEEFVKKYYYNKLTEEETSDWIDKYTTAFYSAQENVYKV